MTAVKQREPGLPVFLLGHSAGGVVVCIYTLEHQAELAGLICERFALQVPAPDFALAVLKGLSHVAPHAHAEIYDGYFHDPLHDLGKERVMEDIVHWLEARAPVR